MVDKHSTGGVGDKVSLVLAPILAACGAYVPMISGRGLGHTGGTLDKLDEHPRLQHAARPHRLRAVVREVGCAIIGQTADLAPADRRLYAIRDVTATVVGAADHGLDPVQEAGRRPAALVMDVKVGSGAFLADPSSAPRPGAHHRRGRERRRPAATALLTDMDQCLGRTAGNALEVGEAIAMLRGRARADRDFGR